MKRFFTVIAALVVASCGDGFIASNGLLVRPMDDGSFEIPFRGESGDSEFWCAAGEYVVRSRNLAPTTRIYRLSPPPRRSGEGIIFGLSPEGAQNPGLFIASSDDGLTAAFASTLCRDRMFPND